jgi:hypothetical protein
LWLFLIGLVGYGIASRIHYTFGFSEICVAFAGMSLTTNMVGIAIKRHWLPDDWPTTLMLLSTWFCIWVTVFVQSEHLSKYTVF